MRRAEARRWWISCFVAIGGGWNGRGFDPRQPPYGETLLEELEKTFDAEWERRRELKVPEEPECSCCGLVGLPEESECSCCGLVGLACWERATADRSGEESG